MEWQPTLQGGWVRLEPLNSEDFESLYQVASDPLVWELNPFSDRYKREVFQHFFQSGLESRGAFVVRDQKTNEVMGSSRFHSLNEKNSSIMIGFTFLARKYWGGKYNGELKKLMIQHAFQFVNTILFQAGRQNFRSLRALEKIGAVYSHDTIAYGQDYCVYRIEKSIL